MKLGLVGTTGEGPQQMKKIGVENCCGGGHCSCVLVPLLTTRLTAHQTRKVEVLAAMDLGGYSYYNRPSQGIYAHFDAVAAATSCQLSYMTFR